MTTPTKSTSPFLRLSVVKALFLLAGFLSFVFSVSLWFFVDREQGLFVGIWVPSLWSLGALVLAGGKRDE
jgi:hypothetical protein